MTAVVTGIRTYDHKNHHHSHVSEGNYFKVCFIKIQMTFLLLITRVIFHLLLVHLSPCPKHKVPILAILFIIKCFLSVAAVGSFHPCMFSSIYVNLSFHELLDCWNYPTRIAVRRERHLITYIIQRNFTNPCAISFQNPAACKYESGPFSGQNQCFSADIQYHIHCSTSLGIWMHKQTVHLHLVSILRGYLWIHYS